MMAEIALEGLAARLDNVERRLAEAVEANARKKDWRRVVGKFDDDPDFVQAVIVEGAIIREADREAE